MEVAMRSHPCPSCPAPIRPDRSVANSFAFCTFLVSTFLATTFFASPAKGAETILWPANGQVRENPSLLEPGVFADGPAGNVVVIQDHVQGDVAGAAIAAPPGGTAAPSAQAGAALRNTVIIQQGVVEGFVDGGWSDEGPAEGNTLIISGGTVRKLARGGGSNGGPARGNTLHMSAGELDGSAYGGSSLMEGASGNVLTLSGGTVRHAVVGGSSSYGEANGNRVYMGGGSAASVLGGSAGQGDAKGNRVQVLGGEVHWDIVGGETATGQLATHNTVDIGPKARLAPGVAVFGGLKTEGGEGNTGSATAGNQRTGNVLNLLGWQGTLRRIDNFQYWTMELPERIQAGGSVLTLTEALDMRGASLRLVGGGMKTALRKGDRIVLVRCPSLQTAGITLPSGTLRRGPAPAYAFSLSLDNESAPTAIIATITKVF